MSSIRNEPVSLEGRYPDIQTFPPGISVRAYKRKEPLHLIGNLAPHLTLLISGRIMAYEDSLDGSASAIGLFRPLSLLGEETSDKHGYTHSTNAIARSYTLWD
jgi:hypothetical protein